VEPGGGVDAEPTHDAQPTLGLDGVVAPEPPQDTKPTERKMPTSRTKRLPVNESAYNSIALSDVRGVRLNLTERLLKSSMAGLEPDLIAS
jgi:hypothetical protein